jgi:hypothetical protein
MRDRYLGLICGIGFTFCILAAWNMKPGDPWIIPLALVGMALGNIFGRD